MKTFKKQLYDFMSLSANDKEGDLWIYGDITDDKWYDTDVTPKTIRDALDEMGPVGTLNLRVNSYGGSCVAGNAIVNLIDNYKRKTGAKVNTYIEGIAASMGSGIAMAGDKVYMAENAIFMVHKPFSLAIGNSDDMLKEAEVLEKVEDTLVTNYMRHFNGTEDEMRQLMADESWLTADEALEYGLCDEIVSSVAVAASANGIRINGKEFAEEKLKNKFKETEKRGDTMFEYDNSLAKYGIDEEKFNALNLSVDVIQNVIDSVSVPPTENEYEYNDSLSEYGIDNDTFNSYGVSSDTITEIANNLSNKFNEDMISKIKDAGIETDSIDEVINLAKIGSEVDDSEHDKAKAYDKMVNAAIEDAMKSGVRAKGDEFNDSKWKKILSSLEYDEIVDQKNEWEAEAKLVLKAGKRVSQMGNPDNKGDNFAVNPDDYKFD